MKKKVINMKASKLLTLVLSSVFLVGTSLACADASAHDKFEPNNKHGYVMPKGQTHMNGHKKAPNKHHQFRSQKFDKKLLHMKGHKKAHKHPNFRPHRFAKHPPVIHHKYPKLHGKAYTRLHQAPRIVINL